MKFFKIILIIGFFVFTSNYIFAADAVNETNDKAVETKEESATKKTIKTVTKSLISFGKKVSSGISEGINEGRKSGNSVDGAKIVTNSDEFQSSLEIKLLNLKKGDSDNVVIAELGIKNSKDSPIRVAHLKSNDNILLIDKDGYSVRLKEYSSNPSEITVPEKAAIKRSFTFNGTTIDKASHIRFFKKEYHVEK